MVDIDLDGILHDIATKPVVPLWPHIGKLLLLSKTSTYEAAANGEIEGLFKVGRLYRCSTGPYRARFPIGEQKAA